MGWLILLLLIAGTLALMRVLGVRGPLLKVSGAALLVGASGYALQGRPALPGEPRASQQQREVLTLTNARHAFFGNFTRAESWLRISEALARDGQYEDSVGILQNAVRRYPGDAQLWIGLGNALVDQARGLTPPAELAYRRAAEVSPPGYPAAPFFHGLALARSGDRAAAVRMWRQILADAPTDASWRPLVEQGVTALSAMPQRPPAAGARQP